jgi:hypothetical protein
MLWATGLLIDSASGAAPSFVNRANVKGEGGGHGWGIGYGLIWNGDFTGPPNTASDDQRGFQIELMKPPIGNNMVLGAKSTNKNVYCGFYLDGPCTAAQLGYADLNNVHTPASLYDQQVANARAMGR